MVTEQKLLMDLIAEVHEMNKNITKLLERDKTQNKRIDALEVDLKDVKLLLQQNTLNIHRFIGAISILGIIIPMIFKYTGVL